MSTDNLELLDKIQYPDDLRKLPIEQLPELCAELRQDIVKELSVNPGHLASSLGVVELTVALHYVLNTPYDRIVWDVGHQAYGHKILTGRKDRSTLTANWAAYARSHPRKKASTTRSRADTPPTPSPWRWAWLWLRIRTTTQTDTS